MGRLETPKRETEEKDDKREWKREKVGKETARNVEREMEEIYQHNERNVIRECKKKKAIIQEMLTEKEK